MPSRPFYRPPHRFAALAAAVVGLGSATLPGATQAEEITLQTYGQALQVRADVINGQKQFQRCAACHNPDGHGSGDGLVPAIAAQQFRVIIWQLIDYGQDKRWDVRMQSMVAGHDALSVQDIVDVAAYASDLPPVAGGGKGNGQYTRHGGELYQRSCARCHGSDALGEDQARVPKLAGQSYGYLLRQMHDALEGRRPNFPPSHIERLKPLDHTDLEGVADFLSRLPP